MLDNIKSATQNKYFKLILNSVAHVQNSGLQLSVTSEANALGAAMGGHIQSWFPMVSQNTMAVRSQADNMHGVG